MSPRFEVGQHVVFGNGKVAYEVVAITTTGRVPTCDLVGPKRRYTGVPEGKLNPLHP